MLSIKNQRLQRTLIFPPFKLQKIDEKVFDALKDDMKIKAADESGNLLGNRSNSLRCKDFISYLLT